MHINWDVAEPHVATIKVEKQHIDVLGHANNCEYIKWMEHAAWSHCNAMNMTFEAWQKLGYAWVARHTEIDYLLPAFENDTLLAATWISENDKRISMKRCYQLVRESDGKTLVRGSTKWICIKLATGKACRMPKEFAEGFETKN